jgi:hypothetical protein
VGGDRWSFYGRTAELGDVRAILDRGRWFFAKISGRRRIGKTTLIQQALGRRARVFYVQIPDSSAAGVLTATHDAFDTFSIPAAVSSRPRSLSELADAIGAMARSGYIVVLDEFQYFHRKILGEFSSHLQRVVDQLAAPSHQPITGGLFVLGSVHTEMESLLSDRRAPLFNRITDDITVQHLDVASVLQILRAHTKATPERLLFLWNMFEGVPKFYKDAWEQAALDLPRRELVRRLFFKSSAPLRGEADNWFLHELRGRYEAILKFVARNPGCSNGDLLAHLKELNPEGNEQAAGYIKVLIEKYQMIARRQPILARATGRSGRYFIADNFLRVWLHALSRAVAAVQFRPEDELVDQADQALVVSEGHGLEKLVGVLYEERSRRGLGRVNLTHRVGGYWDGGRTEIDLVALDDESETIRFGTCRRASDKLVASLSGTDAHIARFVAAHAKYRAWRTERVAIATTLSQQTRKEIESRGWIAEDLGDLTTHL